MHDFVVDVHGIDNIIQIPPYLIHVYVCTSNHTKEKNTVTNERNTTLMLEVF